MRDLLDPWRVYARLQNELATLSTVDGRSWGLEGGLSHLIRSGLDGITDTDAERACATSARRERSRARARRLHLAPWIKDVIDPWPKLEARNTLAVLYAETSASEQALLHDVASGAGYSKIARRTGRSVGAARVQVMRLRARLKAIIADPRAALAS